MTAPLTGLVPARSTTSAWSPPTPPAPPSARTRRSPPRRPPPRHRPCSARAEDVKPAIGKVFIKTASGQFVPLTGATQIPSGTVVDALNGTLNITTALPAAPAARATRAKGKKPSRN